jgi:hypothetical protein
MQQFQLYYQISPTNYDVFTDNYVTYKVIILHEATLQKKNNTLVTVESAAVRARLALFACVLIHTYTHKHTT